MRVLGEELNKRSASRSIIENRPGGSGNIASRACQDAQPDGYTICIINADPMIYNQYLFKNLSFDPDKISPIINLFHLIQVLVINPISRRRRWTSSSLCRSRSRARCPISVPRSRALSTWTASAGEGRRLGARAVQGRRRGDQCHSRRVDADRPAWSWQRHVADQRGQDDGAGAGQQHPHAAAAERADAGGSATRVRRRRPGTDCSRRRARRKRLSTGSRPK